jgi:uncharacterized cupin superfamily protein
MPTPNIHRAEFAYDESDPDGYRCGAADLGRQAGGRENAVKAFEVPAGQSVCPYHYEYVEEWLLVLEGAVQLRGPDGERPLQPGDLVCFPAGPSGAHKVTNRDRATARLLMFSSARTPAVAVYPDSDKIGVWPGEEGDTVMLRRADGHIEYYDGER